jgi:hypothetical protein
MDVIVDLLRAIRSRYALAIEEEKIRVGAEHGGRQYYCVYDKQVVSWMDDTRAELTEIFSELCAEAGIPPLMFPRNFPRRSPHW